MRSLKRDDPSCTPWLLTDQWQSLGDHPSTCSDALVAMVRERERVVDATILSVDSTTSGQDHLCKVHLAWSSHEFTLWVIASASFSLEHQLVRSLESLHPMCPLCMTHLSLVASIAPFGGEWRWSPSRGISWTGSAMTRDLC